MIYFFSVISLASLLGLVWLFARQTILLSRGDVLITDGADLHLFIEPTINYLAYKFVSLCREIGRRSMLFTLSLGRELSIAGRQVLGRLEHRFAHLINLVKGRGMPVNRGSVSFFLRELDEYKQSLNQN